MRSGLRRCILIYSVSLFEQISFWDFLGSGNMQNQILLFHRTVGAKYDDRIQKIFGSLNRQSGVEAHAILWERSNQAKEGKFKAGGNYEVICLPFASKRMPRPGPIWSLYEILAESWTGYRIVVEDNKTSGPF